VKIAGDMVGARLLTEREALLRLDATKAAYFTMRHLMLEQLESVQPIGTYNDDMNEDIILDRLLGRSPPCLSMYIS
jgi:hypothetical protein